jgi:two-component system, NarL family, nitrate/nitrite response regulator NarL
MTSRADARSLTSAFKLRGLHGKESDARIEYRLRPQAAVGAASSLLHPPLFRASFGTTKETAPERSRRSSALPGGQDVNRVLVVSGICLYRDGLTELLGRAAGIDVVGTASDVNEGIALYRSLDPKPDVILLDTLHPDGVGIIRHFRDVLPEARILALTVPNRERSVIDIAEAGVSGFVTSEASITDLIAAIESVAHGEALCPPSIVAALLLRLASLARDRQTNNAALALTDRERQIVSLIDAGLSNKQIAQRLRIELPTVKNHVHHILTKLGVQRRSEAAALVREGSLSRATHGI